MLFARLLILRIRRLLSDYVVSMRHSIISSSSSFGRAAFDFERKESKASWNPKPIIQTRTPTMSLAHILYISTIKDEDSHTCVHPRNSNPVHSNNPNNKKKSVQSIGGVWKLILRRVFGIIFWLSEKEYRIPLADWGPIRLLFLLFNSVLFLWHYFHPTFITIPSFVTICRETFDSIRPASVARFCGHTPMAGPWVKTRSKAFSNARQLFKLFRPQSFNFEERRKERVREYF